MADEAVYESYDDYEEFEDEFHGGTQLPWWVRKAPPLLFSGVFHAILLIVSAYLICAIVDKTKELKTALIKREIKQQPYDPELKKWVKKVPPIHAEKIVEDPIIKLEDEVELTKDIPRGTSLDALQVLRQIP